MLQTRDIEWDISPLLVEYPHALARMEQRVDAILAGNARGLIWLLEHPPLYTSGTSAKARDLLEHARFPVYSAGRGGQYTYHGPGQRIAYVMADLKTLFYPDPPDIRRYVHMLERWIITTLAHFGVDSFTREGRVGVWVTVPGGEAKIAAIGIRVRKWVAYHGICLNVHPDISHYAGIIPCGIHEHGVTSLHTLGIKASMEHVDEVLRKSWATLQE